MRLVHTERYLEFLRDAHAAWGRLAAGSEAVIPNVHPRRLTKDNYPSSIVGRAGYHLYDMSCPIMEATWPAVLWNSHCAAEAALRVVEGSSASAYAMAAPRAITRAPTTRGAFAISTTRRSRPRFCARDSPVSPCSTSTSTMATARRISSTSGRTSWSCRCTASRNLFDPFYWGYAGESGAGDGRGANFNLPLPRGAGDEEYLEHLDVALERIRTSGASALVVSLGFDAYERDPLSWLEITTDGFGRMASAVAALGLPTVLVQEGGDHCPDLGRNLAAFLSGFEDRHLLEAG